MNLFVRSELNETTAGQNEAFHPVTSALYLTSFVFIDGLRQGVDRLNVQVVGGFIL